MALKLEEKKVVVAEVNAVAAKALSVVGAENRGLTVTQMTDLRAKARKEGVYLRIVKNTLAHFFRVHFSGAERTHCPGILQRRSGRGGAHRQGVCEGQRQVGDDAGVAGRAAAQAPGHRPRGFIAHACASGVATARGHQGADFEVRWNAGGSQLQVGENARCCS
jgi:hypothetical protein